MSIRRIFTVCLFFSTLSQASNLSAMSLPICDLNYDDGKFQITLNTDRVESYESFPDAIAKFQNNLTEQKCTVAFHEDIKECSIEHEKQKFYVTKDGKRFPQSYETYVDALDFRHELLEQKVCRFTYSPKKCEIIPYSYAYYIKVGDEFLVGYFFLDTVLKVRDKLVHERICSLTDELPGAWNPGPVRPGDPASCTAY